MYCLTFEPTYLLLCASKVLLASSACVRHALTCCPSLSAASPTTRSSDSASERPRFLPGRDFSREASSLRGEEEQKMELRLSVLLWSSWWKLETKIIVCTLSIYRISLIRRWPRIVAAVGIHGAWTHVMSMIAADAHWAISRAVCVPRFVSPADSRTERLRVLQPASIRP